MICIDNAAIPVLVAIVIHDIFPQVLHLEQIVQGGVLNERLIIYSPPGRTVNMLMNETACACCLDFSTDGRLLVSGSSRGELVVWDVIHRWVMCGGFRCWSLKGRWGVADR